jgi:hypothetical protein
MMFGILSNWNQFLHRSYPVHNSSFWEVEFAEMKPRDLIITESWFAFP